MERTRSQLEAEVQSLEAEKNRVIEEAFIRAESEMKAVHQNLAGVCVYSISLSGCERVCSVHVSMCVYIILFFHAGVRMNLLTLQPALRTLTCDYNCLKRQVLDFPYMLQNAIAEAKQEVRIPYKHSNMWYEYIHLWSFYLLLITA